MHKHIFIAVFLFIGNIITAQTTPSWLRYPSISPDGSTIVFTYKGDLYKVASSGGTAHRINPARSA